MWNKRQRLSTIKVNINNHICCLSLFLCLSGFVSKVLKGCIHKLLHSKMPILGFKQCYSSVPHFYSRNYPKFCYHPLPSPLTWRSLWIAPNDSLVRERQWSSVSKLRSPAKKLKLKNSLIHTRRSHHYYYIAN